MRISDWSSDVCSSDLPRTDAEVAPTTLKRIAECKGARSRNVHQPIPGASQQAHRIAAIRLNLGLVAPSQHALLCGFVKHGHGATNVQPGRLDLHRRLPDHCDQGVALTLVRLGPTRDGQFGQRSEERRVGKEWVRTWK